MVTFIGLASGLAGGQPATFWRDLTAGHFLAGEFQRRTKSGERVWIQASYNPIFDRQRRVLRVIKLASEITEKRRIETATQRMAGELQQSAGSIDALNEELTTSAALARCAGSDSDGQAPTDVGKRSP